MNNLMKLYVDNKFREKTPVMQIENVADATIYIYDIIDPDWGVSALSVIDAINNIGYAKVLNVRINSAGGSVFESRAIMSAISRFNGKTVAYIDSLCASAATSIALSCDEVVMAKGSLFMIHNASGLAWGDKNAMRETANALEKVELSIINDYVAKTGKDASEVMKLMDSETWFTAEEALANGFVDSVAKLKDKVSNNWNLDSFKNAPKIENNIDEIVDDPRIEIETLEPASEGFFMSASNANRLHLLEIL